jgi:hypothetical protein
MTRQNDFINENKKEALFCASFRNLTGRFAPTDVVY